jgi:hypothetical protein
MKFLSSQLGYLTTDREGRTNLRALAKDLAFLGIMGTRSVLLTTNDDAMNIYLAVYCRRLNRDLRIVSRITHERNLEAIHRAGADFVLSYTTLGIEAVMSLLGGYPPVLLGEGVELFSVPVPASPAGRVTLTRPLCETATLRVHPLTSRQADGAVNDASACLRSTLY